MKDVCPIRRFTFDPEVEDERLLTLHYLCNEIRRRGVEGSIAEAGVMYGYFANHMKNELPGIPFHLFDTFDGFVHEDIAHDLMYGLLTMVYDYRMFNGAGLDKAKKNVPNGIFHVGDFNNTKNEIPDGEKFSLVSIDMDLYRPTKDALEFFIPRMNPGGYIMVHDYNHPEDFHGAGEAVIELEDSLKFKMVPIPDYSGTIVIAL